MGVEERGREGEWGKVTKVNEVREGGEEKKGRNVKGLRLGKGGMGREAVKRVREGVGRQREGREGR